jgi:Flp pilus assembly protein TadG
LLNLKRSAHQLGSADGAEIAEAALVLPLVFMLLMGIIWFGRAFNIYATIQQAAQQGAITAARETCATCTNGNTFPAPAAAQNAVFAVIQADNLDVTQIQVPTNPPNCGFVGGTPQACSACASPPGGGCTPATGTGSLPVYVCQNVQLNPTATPPQCGSVVSFQYPFTFHFPGTSLNMQTIMLSAQAQSRMEN